MRSSNPFKTFLFSIKESVTKTISLRHFRRIKKIVRVCEGADRGDGDTCADPNFTPLNWGETKASYFVTLLRDRIVKYW